MSEATLASKGQITRFCAIQPRRRVRHPADSPAGMETTLVRGKSHGVVRLWIGAIYFRNLGISVKVIRSYRPER